MLKIYRYLQFKGILRISPAPVPSTYLVLYLNSSFVSCMDKQFFYFIFKQCCRQVFIGRLRLGNPWDTDSCGSTFFRRLLIRILVPTFLLLDPGGGGGGKTSSYIYTGILYSRYVPYRYLESIITELMVPFDTGKMMTSHQHFPMHHVT